jgi:hypothetical protein
LQQDYSATGPNQKWAGDITFVRIGDRWAYLAVVIYLFSRRVVGWAIGPQCDGQLAAQALRSAVHLRKPAPGLIVHTDRGSTYVSGFYKNVLEEFYSAFLPALGYGLEEGPEGLSYALPVEPGQSPVLPDFYVKPTFDERPASAGNGSMVAFEARNQRQVRDLHAAALVARPRGRTGMGARRDDAG